MGSFGVQEMAVVAVLALLVFGPERLPEVARNLAKVIARFREETSKSIDELKRAANVEDLEGELAQVRGEFKNLRGDYDRARKQLTGALDSGAAPKRVDPPPFDPDAT